MVYDVDGIDSFVSISYRVTQFFQIAIISV